MNTHDHACGCGTADRPHDIGQYGCARFMIAPPKPAAPHPIFGPMWFVGDDPDPVTDYTLRFQWGYWQHSCGCWSRHASRPGRNNWKAHLISNELLEQNVCHTVDVGHADKIIVVRCPAVDTLISSLRRKVDAMKSALSTARAHIISHHSTICTGGELGECPACRHADGSTPKLDQIDAALR